MRYEDPLLAQAEVIRQVRAGSPPLRGRASLCPEWARLPIDKPIRGVYGCAMTITEAAEVLGLAPGTLRIQVKLGKLKAHRMGGRLYVTPLEVARYREVSLREKEPK
jgi:excisionase family DNA binding protein